MARKKRRKPKEKTNWFRIIVGVIIGLAIFGAFTYKKAEVDLFNEKIQAYNEESLEDVRQIQRVLNRIRTQTRMMTTYLRTGDLEGYAIGMEYWVEDYNELQEITKLMDSRLIANRDLLEESGLDVDKELEDSRAIRKILRDAAKTHEDLLVKVQKNAKTKAEQDMALSLLKTLIGLGIENVDDIEKEVITVIAEDIVIDESPSEENIIQELLGKIPDVYWFWDEDASLGAVVSGAQRRVIITFYEGVRIVSWGVTDSYWNTQTGDVIIFGDWINEACLESLDDEKPTDLYYRRKGRPFVGVYYKTRMQEYELPLSPVDWMVEYKDEIPLEIRRVEEVIKTPLSAAYVTTDLSIKFNKKHGDGFWVLKINSKMGVPLMVEDHQDSKTVKRYKYEYDTISHVAFDRTPLQVLASFDPSEKIIVSEEEFLVYTSNRWCTRED